MKKNQSLLMMLSSCLTLVPSIASAAGWSPPLTIARAFVEDSDLIIVYTVENTVLATGCLATAYQFAASTDVRRDRAWATILSASLAGKKIQFWVNDTCGVWNYHKASSVMILIAP